ncbi:hypothetical protein [Halosegnis marinus]|uniref:DUF1102 domain-containing protein n=1 Tax=Halosegnis marinus TaxID=3034023 RepID=A0ABD5ZR56_9EURY|nr:hypothetical protein [Halosegnis sp. DT85]
MERRKFLIGAGSLAAGAAAATGTGAFTSVSANRTVTVNVAGDASALLAIERAEEGGSTTPNAQDYVNIESDNTVKLDFTGSDNGASGINDDASTKIANLLDITNQGTQTVEVYPSEDQPGNIAFFAEGPDTNTGTNGNPNYPDPDNDGDQDQGAGFSDDDPVILGTGDTVENIGVRMEGDATGTTLTLIAEETDASN